MLLLGVLGVGVCTGGGEAGVVVFNPIPTSPLAICVVGGDGGDVRVVIKG